MHSEWLVDDLRLPGPAAVEEIARALPSALEALHEPGVEAPRLAIMLRQVICHDVQKLFGGAEVRLDALVVQGRSAKPDPESFYMPGTFRFSDVCDHQQLPFDDEFGLLIYNGQPLHFLDVFIMVSRDRRDSDDLDTLLRDRLSGANGQEAIAALLGLGLAAPTAAAVAGAIGAAAVLGDVAYQVVRSVSDKTIGMYRGSFLQFRDGFGVGRHPGDGSRFVKKDLEFWYETVRDEATAA